MSAEHSSGRHVEHQERHERAHADLEAVRAKNLESLSHSAENDVESSKERAEAARQAIEQLHPQPEKHEHTEAQPIAPTRPLLNINYKLNYQQTMESLQHHLTPVSRSFSKVIHHPAVEKTSEVLENTVARPSVLLGAMWTALIVGTVFYLTDKHFGYMQSGSELLFSFIVGALIGLVIEGVWHLIRR